MRCSCGGALSVTVSSQFQVVIDIDPPDPEREGEHRHFPGAFRDLIFGILQEPSVPKRVNDGPHVVEVKVFVSRASLTTCCCFLDRISTLRACFNLLFRKRRRLKH